MYHVSAQGVDERMINVHYNFFLFFFLSDLDMVSMRESSDSLKLAATVGVRGLRVT